MTVQTEAQNQLNAIADCHDVQALQRLRDLSQGEFLRKVHQVWRDYRKAFIAVNLAYHKRARELSK
jgi:hypothetical protein